MAGIPGSVSITGFIAPTDTTDTYAVTDPLYGIDGLRSVADHIARNNITTARRRQGMLVYTQNDGFYWQLLPSPWNGTDADWTQLILGVDGPQGAMGFQGYQGFQGAMGFQGYQGVVGNQGFQGVGGADSIVPGPQGNQGFQGEPSTVPGPQGPPGNSSTYVFNQAVANTTWTISHNLGKYPSVEVFDTGSTEIYGDLMYIDTDSLTITFSMPVAGVAYLN